MTRADRKIRCYKLWSADVVPRMENGIRIKYEPRMIGSDWLRLEPEPTNCRGLTFAGSFVCIGTRGWNWSLNWIWDWNWVWIWELDLDLDLDRGRIHRHHATKIYVSVLCGNPLECRFGF